MALPGNVVAAKAFTFGTDKTWDAVLTITTSEQSVNAPGVRVGDFVLISPPTHQAGLAVSSVARVDADNVLKIKFINPTAGSITPTASLIWRGLVIHPESNLGTGAFV